MCVTFTHSRDIKFITINRIHSDFVAKFSSASVKLRYLALSRPAGAVSDVWINGSIFVLMKQENSIR